MACALPTIKNRNDFLVIAKKGRLSPQEGLILQALDTLDKSKQLRTTQRVGITVTKKIGTAVIRNRCRRRLRIVANEILLCYGKDNMDYVLIARKTTLNRNIELLKTDLKKALKDLGMVKKIINLVITGMFYG